ncbi:hypothetical protein ACEQPO_27770 [Bacillus sp. SL00103]
MAVSFVKSQASKCEKATLVDIDGKVIEYSKKFLPSIAGKTRRSSCRCQSRRRLYAHC